jgi:hypothetical protein
MSSYQQSFMSYPNMSQQMPQQMPQQTYMSYPNMMQQMPQQMPQQMAQQTYVQQNMPPSVNWGMPTATTELISKTPVGTHMFTPNTVETSHVDTGASKNVIAQGNLIPGSNENIVIGGTLKEPDLLHNKKINFQRHPVQLTNNPVNNPYIVNNLQRTVSQNSMPINSHVFQPQTREVARVVQGRTERTSVVGPYGPNGENIEVGGILEHPSVVETYRQQLPTQDVNVVGGNHAHQLPYH